MSNIQIAIEWATNIYQQTNPGGVWISTNLPEVSRADRKGILKVYKKVWDRVEYDANTGVCSCYKKEA